MALDKLTIIDGGGLSTTSDYRVGVITATKFVGPVEGSITATDATFSGNVSIAGTLTYEDVTNVDSVGIITARNGIKVSTGTATTALVVDGDARVTGILTVGTGSLTLDGPNNLVNVGTALTLGHTQGVQFHTQNLHSAGFEVNQINASGIITASSVYVADSIIHQGDTDTKIDFVSNAVKITAGNKLRIDSGTSNYTTIYGSTNFTPTSSLPKGSGGYVARFRDEEGDDTIVRFHNTNIKNTVLEWSDYGSSSSAGNLVFKGFTSGVEGGRFDGSGNFKLNQDLDVDGHTNLDNVSIAGVTTMGQATIFTTGGTTLLLKDSDSTNPADRSGIAFIDQNSTQTAFIGKASASDAVLTINNTNTINPIRLKVNNTTRLEVGNAGVYATGSLSATGTLSAGGILYIPDDIQHTGDADTKIRFPTNDTISFETAGSERMRIQSNGYVNIGSGTAEEQLTIRNTTQHCLVRIISANNASAGIDMGDPQDTDIGRVRYYHSDGSNTNYMRFDTNGSEKLRIDNAGRLSLGVNASPGSYPVASQARQVQAEIKGGISGNNYHHGSLALNCTNNNANLHLVRSDNTQNANVGLGNISFSGYDGNDFHVAAQISGRRDAAGGNNDVPGRLEFLTTADGASQPTERLRIDSEGVVAVNSTNATSSSVFKICKDGGGEAQLRFETASANTASIVLDSSEQLKFKYGGTEVLRLASNSRVGIGSDVPHRPLSIGAGDGTVALHGGNAGIYMGTHPTGGFQNNCAIARAGANNYHITGSSVGDLCIAGESTKDIIIGTSVNAGAMNERMRFHHDGMVEVTGTGSNLAFNVGGGYIRCVGSQPTVVAHKSSSTFCHIGVENNTNARAFLAYTNDKDFIIGRRTAYTGDHTGYSGADITIDKTNHAVVLSYNGGSRLNTTSGGVNVTGSLECDGITSSGGMATTSGYINLQGTNTTKILLQGVDGNQIRYRNAAGTYTANITSIGNGDTFQLQNEKQSQYLNIETGGVRIGGRLTLPTSDTGISFGPGNAANDSAHIEWKGGSNAGYLRISTDDDSDSITPAEYIEFGDYATLDRQGAFTQHVKIARSEFLVSTGTHTVTTAARFKVNQDGNTEILNHLYLTNDLFMGGELNLTSGGNKNRFIDCSMDDGESLIIRSTQGGDANHENMATFTRNGACSFHFDNSTDHKFQTAAHGMNVHGDIHLGGTNTTTNQNRKIYWTGFDKEATNDFTDNAEIRHTTNVHGITGSVLELKAENDATDGIALNASSGNGQIALNGKIRGNIEMHDYGGRIRPSYGTGDKGIFWQPDPAGGSGDYAHIQYYTDGSGEDTRLRIQCENDGDDDLRLEAHSIRAEGSFSSTNKHFRIPHVLSGLTTTTDLIHSVVEGPQADNLYRGRTTLVAGISTVNIDTTNNMTEGTFVNLNRDVQCFTTNETGWTAIKGSVTGNLLTIIAQDNTCTDTISWMVIGERWDLAMYDPYNPMTDANGKAKTEIPNDSYNKGGDYEQDYISQNRLRVGISTFFRPSIENKEVE